MPVLSWFSCITNSTVYVIIILVEWESVLLSIFAYQMDTNYTSSLDSLLPLWLYIIPTAENYYNYTNNYKAVSLWIVNKSEELSRHRT